ncbi:MAG TPA: tetratricopeptide repeat protein [Thermoanaerobaculia bacterium]|nr:tetratricopeptide repeat protein [Thermoanaerobaculia bacterium]
MKDTHLTHEEIEDLLDDDPEARNRLLLHHLTVCPGCFAVAGYILDLHREGKLDDDFSITAIGLGKSRLEAPALRDQLHRHSFERQKALVADTSRFKSWGLAELLCLQSEEEAAGDPKKAAEIAEIAVAVALALGENEPAEKHWLHLLRAYAYAHLANARRAEGNLWAAEDAFIVADSWWTPAFQDVGDVLGYEARFLAFKASLRRDERRFEDALDLIEEALEADAPSSLKVRILINKAKTYEEIGDLETAIEVLKEAESHAQEGDRDPRVLLCLAQNRLDYLSKAERYMEAKLALADVEEIARELGTRLDRLRLRWTDARITRGLGNTEEAIASLQEVHENLVAEGLLYDAALLALELALVFTEIHQPSGTKEWVKAALPILTSLSVGRETLAAVSLLAKAVEEERLTVELVSQALDVFRRVKQ